MLLHVLAHIDADHQLFIVEEKLRQRPRQLRFSDACGSEENERADRPLGVGKTCAAAPHGIRHALQRVVLADNPQPQPVLHVHELLRFAFQQSARRNARPLAHQLRDVFLIDFFLQHGRALVQRRESFLRLLLFALRRRNLAVADFRHLGQFAGSFVSLLFRFELFNLLLELADFSDGFLFRLPPRLSRAGIFFQRRQFLFDLLAPLLRVRIAFFQQRLALNFQLHDAPLDLVNFHGQGIDLHPQARRRFIDQVDGLVRQEAVRDVTVRKRGRRKNRRILDAHAVVHFIAFFQSAQNRDRIFDRRFADQHRLKPAFQRRIFLDVFLVFVECRCADRAQLAPRQRRFEHVGRVHRAFRGAGSHQRVQFVDEQNDLPFGLGDLFQDGFQTVFKFAAEFRSRHQRRQVQRHDALGLQHVRYVAGNDPLRQAFHDRGLSDAGLADQHRVVFRTPRQYLHHAANLFVAPDYGIELLSARQFRQVARIFFQRCVGSLRILRSHALRSAHSSQCLQDCFVGSALAFQQLSRGFAVLPRNRQKQVLRRNIFVFEAVRFLERALQHVVQRPSHVLLGKALHLRQPADLPLNFLC